MDKAQAITELIGAYGTYADVGDINTRAASDAPQTTAFCISFVVSFSITRLNDDER